MSQGSTAAAVSEQLSDLITEGRLAPGSRVNPASPFISDGRVVEAPTWLLHLREPDLWLGLAAAAVMVYIVIRLRRYRDDT